MHREKTLKPLFDSVNERTKKSFGFSVRRREERGERVAPLESARRAVNTVYIVSLGSNPRRCCHCRALCCWLIRREIRAKGKNREPKEIKSKKKIKLPSGGMGRRGTGGDWITNKESKLWEAQREMEEAKGNGENRILKQKLQLNNNDELGENESCACLPVCVCVAMTRHECMCDTCVDFSIFP